MQCSCHVSADLSCSLGGRPEEQAAAEAGNDADNEDSVSLSGSEDDQIKAGSVHPAALMKCIGRRVWLADPYWPFGRRSWVSMPRAHSPLFSHKSVWHTRAAMQHCPPYVRCAGPHMRKSCLRRRTPAACRSRAPGHTMALLQHCPPFIPGNGPHMRKSCCAGGGRRHAGAGLQGTPWRCCSTVCFSCWATGLTCARAAAQEEDAGMQEQGSRATGYEPPVEYAHENGGPSADGGRGMRKRRPSRSLSYDGEPPDIPGVRHTAAPERGAGHEPRLATPTHVVCMWVSMVFVQVHVFGHL